jgi:hypothetical protein
VSSTRILVLGLDPHRVPGPWAPEPVAAAIARGLEGLAAAGYDAEPCLIGLDGSDDIPDRITAALRSAPWACVVVGGGIRDPEDLLELFEETVNLVRRHAPQAAIAFNSTPEDLVQAVRRTLTRRI